MSLLNDRRIQLFIACMLLIGVLPLTLKPLQFGMDFSGGSVIEIKLDEKLDAGRMEVVTRVLQDRLNQYGLKDLSITPAEDQFVIVRIAESDPAIINKMQALIGQQGRFEALFEGNVVLTSDDIVQVKQTAQEGYGIGQGGPPYKWSVPFLLSNEGAINFARSVQGRCTPVSVDSTSCQEQVYMFIDRPQNAVILMTASEYDEEKNVPSDLGSSETTILLDDVIANSGATLVITNTIDAQTLAAVANKTAVIRAGDYASSFDKLNSTAAKLMQIEKTDKFWIVSALRLENIVSLTSGVTTGEPISSPVIEGHADTAKAAQDELTKVAILLKSGKLPVAVSVGSVSTISSALGESFLFYSAIAGLGAIIMVGFVIFIRYRTPKIAVPMMLTTLSEVFMIVGFAALVGWQLDLPSIAGIIATVGTGVDHLIIITDEAMRKEEHETSIVAKIKKAFSLIFMAASTTIVAMLPLMYMGLGALKGFAIVTIVGSLMGVLIARPAYAAIVNAMNLKRAEQQP